MRKLQRVKHTNLRKKYRVEQVVKELCRKTESLFENRHPRARGEIRQQRHDRLASARIGTSHQGAAFDLTIRSQRNAMALYPIAEQLPRLVRFDQHARINEVRLVTI